jgi:hypothetical protein
VPGWVAFDVEVSADGETLVVSDGLYDGGAVPREAHLVLARRAGEGFERPADQSVLANLGADDLTYAAGLSASGLEIFFTRLAPDLSEDPSIWFASRSADDAPTLALDGLSLYYHRRVGTRFVLERVTRTVPGP